MKMKILFKIWSKRGQRKISEPFLCRLSWQGVKKCGQTKNLQKKILKVASYRSRICLKVCLCRYFLFLISASSLQRGTENVSINKVSTVNAGRFRNNKEIFDPDKNIRIYHVWRYLSELKQVQEFFLLAFLLWHF